MNFLKFLTVFVITLIVTTSNGQNNSKTTTTKQSTSKIEVIDFYGAHRCVTCKTIEANAKYTVDTYFAAEKKKGTVVFKTINVDDDKNYKIAERFEATGTALFLNVIKNGKETHIDLTDFAFMNGRDKAVFSKELKAKIETELKKL
jgi:thiol-disulfide isomerase/thioredoxin